MSIVREAASVAQTSIVKRLIIGVVALSLVSGPAIRVGGQETPARSDSGATSKAWAERAAALALAEAKLYDLRFAAPDGQQLTLVEQPVLKWSNTYDASVYGSSFVWMHEGRPQVIASFFKFFTSKVNFDGEFHSLATEPLVARKGNQLVWQPEPGLAMTPLSEAPPPARTRPARLVQMRELAKGFSAELTTVRKTTHRLRLLPQPLLRYGAGSEALLDGALFAFTRETDPDVLLLLEARHDAEGTVAWHYGLARMHVGALTVKRGDQEVWSAQEQSHPYVRPEGKYSLFQDLAEPAIDNASSAPSP